MQHKDLRAERPQRQEVASQTHNMDLMQFKVKIGLILFTFLLISASFVSSSGRATKYVSNLEEKVGAINEETFYHEDEEEENDIIHERVLRANTRDYGRYDPAPSLVRPHFKLIPN